MVDPLQTQTLSNLLYAKVPWIFCKGPCTYYDTVAHTIALEITLCLIISIKLCLDWLVCVYQINLLPDTDGSIIPYWLQHDKPKAPNYLPIGANDWEKISGLLWWKETLTIYFKLSGRASNSIAVVWWFQYPYNIAWGWNVLWHINGWSKVGLWSKLAWYLACNFYQGSVTTTHYSNRLGTAM